MVAVAVLAKLKGKSLNFLSHVSLMTNSPNFALGKLT